MDTVHGKCRNKFIQGNKYYINMWPVAQIIFPAFNFPSFREDCSPSDLNIQV